MGSNTLPLVSVVTPTFNRTDKLKVMLQSLIDSDYPRDRIEVAIVDNASDPQLSQHVRAVWPDALLIDPGKNLFSNPARKIGAEQSSGEIVFFLDDDNKLDKRCLRVLVNGLLKYPEAGMVGPVMLVEDTDSIWCAGAQVTDNGTVPHIYKGELYSKTQLPDVISEIDFFPNACMVRREVLNAVPLDDKVFPHNWAETDFGLRVKQAGYGILCLTSAFERHYIGYDGPLTRFNLRSIYDQARSRMAFRKRHLSKPSQWFRFWAMVFPASAAIYQWRIFRQPRDRIKLFSRFWAGTIDGLITPVPPAPTSRHATNEASR